VDENAPLRRPDNFVDDDPLQERSVPKIGCEEAVSRYFSGPVATTRVGITVGPRDPTDRFSWWPVCLARALAEGGEVLAPGDPKRPVQFSDARDIAAWMVGRLAAGTPGTHNAVGPGREVPLSKVLDACRLAADEADSEGAGSVEMTWAAEGFLREQLREIPEEGRPLWFPEDQIPFQKVDSSKALAAGLTFRLAYDTARDTLAWVYSRPGGRGLGAGLSANRTRAAATLWHSRRG
jgi:2'-hydroxyisoflavone reductase